MSFTFIATQPPEYAADGLPECLCHGSWMTHPVVGAGQKFRPMRVGPGAKQMSRLEAFLDLQWQTRFVARIVPGISGNVMTLSLKDGTRADYDVATNWNANPTDVRAFLVALEECGLITEPLALGLIAATPRFRSNRDQLPRATRAAVLEKTSGKCVYCGARLTAAKGQPNSFHADHVLPVVSGGSDSVANLVPSCAQCNSRKGAKTMIDFLKGNSDGS